METAQTSAVWLASCLDTGQNELIHDSASSRLVVGVLFFLDLFTRQQLCEVAGVRMGVSASVTRFPEAPAGTDHWQPAAPSAPAKQHGLRPPLFPTERPSLFWTHASTERLGARPGQLSGVVL